MNRSYKATSQSVMMQQQQQRSNRHMVFLQEQQQQQQSQQQSHCGYPTAEMQMSYGAKMHDDLARRLHSSYSQEEQQQQQQVNKLKNFFFLLNSQSVEMRFSEAHARLRVLYAHVY